MAFGLSIDGPLLIIPFIVMVIFKDKIAKAIKRIPLPNFLLYLLVSLPLMIYEENINCGAFGCKFTLFPSTIPALLFFIIILGLIVKWTHVKNVLFVTVIFSIFGALFELFIGGSNAEFRALSILPFIFIFAWTMVSYAFIAVIPLAILMED